MRAAGARPVAARFPAAAAATTYDAATTAAVRVTVGRNACVT